MDLARSDPAADIAENVRDVLPDQRQRADRQDGDQGKDQRVLDERMTLLPVPEARQGHQSLRLGELEHMFLLSGLRPSRGHRDGAATDYIWPTASSGLPRQLVPLLS